MCVSNGKYSYEHLELNSVDSDSDDDGIDVICDDDLCTKIRKKKPNLCIKIKIIHDHLESYAYTQSDLEIFNAILNLVRVPM